MLENYATTEVETWRSPASGYKRQRKGSAQIATAWYLAGTYHCYRVRDLDYFFAKKRIYITVLKIDGETWMVDDPRHWWAMEEHAAAYEGHVLCAGLGLGLIVHALDANPKVEKITVVERSQDVIDLVGPQVPQDKLEIINADWFDQSKETIPDVDGVLFDLFVGDGREFIGIGIEVATEIMHRWDFPLTRIHGLANPWIGEVAKQMATMEQSDEFKEMIERVKAHGFEIAGVDR